MKLFQYYRKKAMVRRLPLLLLTLTAAVILLLRSNVLAMIQGPAPLYGVPADRLEGAYVTVEVPYLYAAYAQTLDQNGETLSVEFVIDANENQFMGLLVSGAQISDAMALRQESQDYAATGVLPKAMTVTGTVMPLVGDSRTLYDACLGWKLNQEELDAVCLPLVLKAGTVGGLTPLWCWILFGAGILCLGLAGLLVFRMLGKGKARTIVKQARMLRPEDPKALLAQMEELFRNMNLPFGSDGELLLYAGERNCWLMPVAMVSWGYIQPKASGWQLVLCRNDGRQTCQRMTLHQAQHALEVLANSREDLAIGYHPALAQAWARDPQAVAGVYRNLRDNHTPMMYGPKV